MKIAFIVGGLILVIWITITVVFGGVQIKSADYKEGQIVQMKVSKDRAQITKAFSPGIYSIKVYTQNGIFEFNNVQEIELEPLSSTTKEF